MNNPIYVMITIVIIIGICAIGLISMVAYNGFDENNKNEEKYGKRMCNEEAICFEKCNGDYIIIPGNKYKQAICHCKELEKELMKR